MTTNKPTATSGGLYYFIETHGHLLGTVDRESDEAKFLADIQEGFKHTGKSDWIHTFNDRDGLWYDVRFGSTGELISCKPLPFDCPKCEEQTLELTDNRKHVRCPCGYESAVALKTRDDQ
ncbi:hypothetical protein KAR91_33895 [Candidatus Pacearchaeota archaeon]|nr:hypothetical protein [Candidatus Pacearchaeota archaeon]